MKILAFFANGCEEIEGLTVVDLARRAGIETEMVSINETTTVEGSHKIKFTTDTTIVDVDFERVNFCNSFVEKRRRKVML